MTAVNKIFDAKPVVRLLDLKYTAEEKILIDKALNRTRENAINIPTTSKKRTEKALPAPPPPTKKSKKEISCRICADSHFSYQSDLNE